MFGEKCPLCGGRLVDNRCVECGLDQSKSDASDEVKVNKSEDTTKIPKKLKKAKKITGILVIIAIFTAVFSVILRQAEGNIKRSEDLSPIIDLSENSEDSSPYSQAKRELENSGEDFQTDLTAGEYRVGIHIPEGLYTCTRQDGSGVFYLTDLENIIYISETMGPDYQDGVAEAPPDQLTDVRLYQDAVLKLSEGLKMQLKSNNAQIDTMRSLNNPASEEVVLQPGSSYTVGSDILEGIYDLSIKKSDCSIQWERIIENPYPDNGGPKTAMMKLGDITLRAYEGSSQQSYKNVILLKGTNLTISQGEGTDNVFLTPSK